MYRKGRPKGGVATVRLFSVATCEGACNFPTTDRLDVAAECFVRSREATASSARRKGSGNFLPRFSARRSIPAQAFGLKKYWGSTGPVSKICESEHATPPLRHSEPLRVES